MITTGGCIFSGFQFRLKVSTSGNSGIGFAGLSEPLEISFQHDGVVVLRIFRAEEQRNRLSARFICEFLELLAPVIQLS